MEQQPRLPLWFLVANCALIVVAFFLGVGLGDRRLAELPTPQAQALDLVWQEIVDHHVEPQDGRALLDRAIAAMTNHLDEYSRYVPPSEVAQYDELSTGRYEGVGMRQQLHGDDLVVLHPFPGGPAELAGIVPGDVLVAVDDQHLSTIPIADREARAVELVRGPAQTKVRLTVRRADGERVLTVQRGAVQPASVKWARRLGGDDAFGYLHLADFHRGARREVEATLQRLAERGPLQGLVLDLRGNGGGNLDECVWIANLFLREGTIVSTRRRNQLVEKHDAVADQCRYPDLPLVVLIDGGSASASEVLAGALQDHHRATLVGSRSYGKGVVNTVYSWPSFRLKLTTAHYYTPNGRNIEGRSLRETTPGGTAPTKGGIEPDVAVAAPAERQPEIARALRALEVPWQYREAVAAVATRFGFTLPQPPGPDGDPVLAAGLQQLGGGAGK